MLFNVYFDPHNAIPVDQPNESMAKRLARMIAWSLTGKWLPVLKIELLSGSMQTHTTEES